MKREELKIRATWVSISEIPYGYQNGMVYEFEMVVDGIIYLKPLGVEMRTGLKSVNNLVYNNISEMMKELGNISKI